MTTQIYCLFISHLLSKRLQLVQISWIARINILLMFLFRIAGHPLAQNERCLHMFLQEESIDRNYIPGKVRQ